MVYKISPHGNRGQDSTNQIQNYCKSLEHDLFILLALIWFELQQIIANWLLTLPDPVIEWFGTHSIVHSANTSQKKARSKYFETRSTNLSDIPLILMTHQRKMQVSVLYYITLNFNNDSSFFYIIKFLIAVSWMRVNSSRFY